jgi:glycosyltransferase involved in cell wall biosynthesis
MRIGLVAISKNNEDIILRMLKSAVPRVDVVHLTDTGSTDKTVELAREYLTSTGKPFTIATHIETPFHFANARNVSIDALDGSCDFLLSLDTDDVLPPEWQWPDFKADVYSQYYPYTVFRLWRTKKGIRYVNRIHEVIQWSPDCVTANSNQSITHLQSGNRDPERNIQLLKIEDSTLRTLFYIGNEYSDLGRREQAVIYYQHYINRCQFEPHWQEELMCATWRCARHLERLDRIEESNAVTRHGLAINPAYAELWRQLSWNYRGTPQETQYSVRANQCKFFPHLFAEGEMYQAPGWNILRPGANGDLLMLSAVTTQLQNCVLYTQCKEVGAMLDGVVSVKDPSEWDLRDKSFKDLLPMYPRDDLKEHIIETFCKQAGVPMGPMRLKG